MSSSASRCRSTRSAYWNNFGDDWVPVWSPDSKWLAYSTRLANYLGAIHVYSLASGKATQITDGMSDAKHPVFDRDGKYPVLHGVDRLRPVAVSRTSAASARPVTRSIYLAVLTKDLPSPFAPESDEEKARRASEAGARQARMTRRPSRGRRAPKTPATSRSTSRISVSGFSACRCPRAATWGLQVGKPGVLFAHRDASACSAASRRR